MSTVKQIRDGSSHCVKQCLAKPLLAHRGVHAHGSLHGAHGSLAHWGLAHGCGHAHAHVRRRAVTVLGGSRDAGSEGSSTCYSLIAAWM